MSGHNENLPAVVLPDPEDQTETEKIAHSVIPYSRDDARARYLSLRASGFTIREALRLIGYAHSTLSKWRLDPEFVDVEKRLPEYRKELAAEYVGLEFTRNYRLVLEKDYRVLQRSLTKTKDEFGREVPIELSEQEHAYLMKMRSHYTPQQLQILEALLRGEQGQVDQEFNFTEFVIRAAREKVEIRGRRAGDDDG